MAFEDSCNNQNQSPIVFSPRPGCQIIAAGLLDPTLAATLKTAANLIQLQEQAKGEGEADLESQFEVDSEYFICLAEELLGLLARHVGGEYAEIYAFVQEAYKARRGTVQ